VAKVLLIEDDEDFREFYAAGLRQSSHEVTVASSGRFVTGEIGKIDFGMTFDVIVTDILMPDVDGLEVIRLLKATYPACKIIAMSGGGRLSGSAIYLHLAEAFGVDATLAKPIGIPELCDAVNRRMNAA
jgi:CheY-like chemotaxis protein